MLHDCSMCGQEYDIDRWDACPDCDPAVQR